MEQAWVAGPVAAAAAVERASTPVERASLPQQTKCQAHRLLLRHEARAWLGACARATTRVAGCEPLQAAASGGGGGGRAAAQQRAGRVHVSWQCCMSPQGSRRPPIGACRRAAGPRKPPQARACHALSRLGSSCCLPPCRLLRRALLHSKEAWPLKSVRGALDGLVGGSEACGEAVMSRRQRDRRHGAPGWPSGGGRGASGAGGERRPPLRSRLLAAAGRSR